MKDKTKTVHLLTEISDELRSKDEHQSLIKFAGDLGIIYGQAVQIDITGKDLKFNGITFGEYGVGKIIVNALES